MADKTRMDPDVYGLLKQFYEAGLNTGAGYPVLPSDVDASFDRFILLNTPVLEQVRMYRA